MSGTAADVVVVAAGASSRMGGIDKVSAPIGGRPLLAWTLAPFASEPGVERIVVVAAGSRVEELAAAPWFPEGAIVVAGGARRQESVAAGVAAIERSGADDDRIVLVHDGARPAVRPALIGLVRAAAAEHGAAIPGLPVVETLKRVDGDRIGATVDRDRLVAAQTPQGIRLGILREAWRRFPPGGRETFTDEAALLEACTIPVHVVPGQPDNLKVTLPVDLDRAAAALGVDRPRVGYGEDAHPFGPGSPLRLGGAEIAGAPRLAGHSDGDVVLHAVADALLGAAGFGDLGRLFPADDRTPRGADSTAFVREVVERLGAAGWRAGTLDVTVIGARPRLGPWLDAIRASIAAAVGMDEGDVNVAASTGNLSGDEGAGRTIAARVVATIRAAR